MHDLPSFSRRSLLAAAAGTGLATGWTRSGRAAETAPEGVRTYQSADFYDAEGNFLVDRAREAYFDMFARFGYPVSETIRRDMWILDFQLGDFARVGMAGIFWLNRQDFGYFGHEIYLLPGQMIAEHQHVRRTRGLPRWSRGNRGGG